MSARRHGERRSPPVSSDAATAVSRRPPEEIAAVMAARARRLAEPPATDAASAGATALAVFELGAERYAVEARHVREVVAVPEITPVPDTRPWVLGLSNFRGELLAMIDLRRLVGLRPREDGHRARVVVLGHDRAALGVVVDAACELAMVDGPALGEPPATPADSGCEHVRAVTADGLVILDGAALLDDPQLLIEERRDGMLRPTNEEAT